MSVRWPALAVLCAAVGVAVIAWTVPPRGSLVDPALAVPADDKRMIVMIIEGETLDDGLLSRRSAAMASSRFDWNGPVAMTRRREPTLIASSD